MTAEVKKRKKERIPSTNLLTYFCIDENDQTLLQGMGRTLNVSEGGILLETHVPIDPQCIVCLTIGMEDDLMHFRGKIIHSRERDDGKFESGVEFVEMDKQKLRFLKQYIIIFKDQENKMNREVLSDAPPISLEGGKTSGRDRIEALVKEAELYRAQGLLSECKEKYQELLQFLQNHEHYSRHQKLIDAVDNKIHAVEEKLSQIQKEIEKPELSEEIQNLIQKLFSFSRDKDTAAMEGAVALAKFGQHEKAVAEFKRLLREGVLPLEAAKNILRCHLSFFIPELAIEQFKRWMSRNDFSKDELGYLRRFLSKLLEKRGVKADLPKLVETAQERAERKKKEEEFLDISSVGIQMQHGPLKGEVVEFEVMFQSGNTISVIIPARQKDLVSTFKPGLRLKDMQCYSLIAVFNGSGFISGRSKIKSGPKKGDYTLDITIDEA